MYMGSVITSFLGRLLLIPIALSGVCLSMVVGVPMVGAMELVEQVGNSNAFHHDMGIVGTQDHDDQSGCCKTVRMEHDVDAITPDNAKLLVTFLTMNMSWAIPSFYWHEEAPSFLKTSLDPPSFRAQSFLTGTVIKRE